MIDSARNYSVETGRLADAVVASFAMLDQICRRAAIEHRRKLRRFEVHLTDLAEVWTFDPRPGSQCFVPGAIGPVDLRLHVLSVDWLRFVLARHGKIDPTTFRIDGDLRCLEPFMTAFSPRSWLASRASQS